MEEILMRKITDVCPFCGEETLSYEPGCMTTVEGKDVKFCYDFVCENCCEEWTVWETYVLTEKKRWYSKYVEVEENMLNEDKVCTCDECCGGDNCKSQDEKPACETKDADADAIKVNLEVELDEEKLKKAVDSIVDEAFEKAGKAVGTPSGSWDDFFRVWEDLWPGLSKEEEEPFKITCMTNDEIERKIPRGSFEAFNTFTDTWDDLWKKPAKKINSKGGHPQDK
jgi:hypothetical protein